MWFIEFDGAVWIFSDYETAADSADLTWGNGGERIVQEDTLEMVVISYSSGKWVTIRKAELVSAVSELKY